jgi:DNA-binding MurR/RpiR family transcriptional regulator
VALGRSAYDGVNPADQVMADYVLAQVKDLTRVRSAS